MLINWQAPEHVYLVCGKTDLRKGIDGLAMVVAENFGLDLYNNSLFLFCGSRNDRFKALYWDDEGFILLYKRYENGSLRWPKNKSEVKELKPEQLNALFTGLSPFPERHIHTIKPGNLY
ncbi:IS66 family insertion sequence element accessory protein TnpB [Limosilactobacillus reuteri]|uniref:IS66 family insertion sequence element accessory protein TnpB n=1 Tax=Limosilactobacillus reuteri TaxID=1598 RepID=UPI001E3E4988|nr:IS66 family insertion sequence element accessory protein TnpB [Limosilactobacillus reuteri]UFK66116.1 hypothetical protein IU404_01555 [Limosilactobacillus reuteri]UFK67608.1 hypothetical protein IVR12_00580 [Limosilactobacillus reuteri]